jgi:Ca2+-binding RTX toxin-like protein
VPPNLRLRRDDPSPGADVLSDTREEALAGRSLNSEFYRREQMRKTLAGLTIGLMLAMGLMPAVTAQEGPTCLGLAPTVVGTVGTEGDDVIIGTAGNDVIYAYGGNDVVCGGLGNDTIYGGDGDDELLGDEALFDPTVPGGADLIYGGNGNDMIGGEGGSDRLAGEAGDDFAAGMAGVDWVIGGDGYDELFGGPDADYVFGGNDDDVLYGNFGSDLLAGGPGVDYLNGDLPFDPLIDPSPHQDVCTGGGDDGDTLENCEVTP